jgi:hypothetical protein
MNCRLPLQSQKGDDGELRDGIHAAIAENERALLCACCRRAGSDGIYRRVPYKTDESLRFFVLRFSPDQYAS